MVTIALPWLFVFETIFYFILKMSVSPTSTGYEYLDHTADVQIHSWGNNLIESFTQAANALIDYMTSRDTLSPLKSYSLDICAEDLQKLLYKFLDEILYHFYVDYAACQISLHEIRFDSDNLKWQLTGEVWGETFDRDKHRRGCEVKAITYSNMKVQSIETPFDIYVIIDI
jgi:SHS2 domain-containing protein